MNDSKIDQPRVTVYIPTYNRVKLLQRAVESVLNQDYKNIELIVTDDRSTDDTADYLKKISKVDTRVKYFINKENSGACVSRNKAIFNANGEFITGLDDDDFFLPNRISDFIKSWDKAPKDCIALYSNNIVKNVDDNYLRIKRKQSCTSKDLICSNSIGNQIFTKTHYLKQIGGFDNELPAWQDLECWYRLLIFYDLKAYLSPSYTYVVDTSHPHERITTKRTKTVVGAYEYLCEKHKLTTNQRKILEMQLTPYTKARPKLFSVLRRLAFVPQPYNTRNSLSVVYNSLKNKIIN